MQSADAIFVRMTPDEQRREIARLDYQIYTEEAAKRLEYEIRFGEMVFKALVLVNGGAMVALFSLVGALGSKTTAQMVVAPERLWLAFLSFSIGLMATLVAGICAYFTQRFFAESTINQAWIAQADMIGSAANPAWETGIVNGVQIGNRFLFGAIGAVMFAAAGFVVGAALALAAGLPA